MSNSRIDAKEAKSLSEKAKKDIAEKNLILKSHQKKFKLFFQEIFEAAIDGQTFFVYTDEDLDFLNFCYKEFAKLNFDIEICDLSTELDREIEKIQNEILIVEKKIELAGETAISEMERWTNRIHKFLIPHPEYVAVYEWLEYIFERDPLLNEDWYLIDRYSVDWHLKEYQKPYIVTCAEHEGLLDSKNVEFKWQETLSKFIRELNKSFEKSVQKINLLNKKLYKLEAKQIELENDRDELEKEFTFFDDDTEKIVFKENFRRLRSDEDIDLLEIISFRICWDKSQINSVTNDYNDHYFSPETLHWISSELGQQFLDRIDENIKFSSENGKCETYLKYYRNSDQTFFIKQDSQEVPAPHPDTTIKIYLSMGFNAEKISGNNLIKTTQKSSFAEVKLSW